MMLLPALAGCTGSGGPETTAEQTLPATEPPAAVLSFPLTEDGASLYTVSADALTWAKVSENLSTLQATFEARLGCALPLNDDTKPYKILLSLDLDESVSWDLSVGADGNVRLAGGSPATLGRAMDTLTSLLFTGTETPAVDPAWHLGCAGAEDFLDNSSLLSYTPPTADSLKKSSTSGKLFSADWLDTAVIVELKVDTATWGGTFADSYDLVDFYASVGVNCFWLAPIYARGNGNGYGNLGPDTIEPKLTGKEDYDEGFAVLRDFIAYAHSKGIYVLLDVIAWGVDNGSPLVTEHPKWFSGEAWGGAAFNWANKEFVEWYTGVCVDNILKTDADGFRCDCEPNYSGYRVFGDVRDRLAAQGKYIVVMSEDGSDRSGTYDLEQDGVLDYTKMDRAGYFFTNRVNFFADGLLDIVESSKTGVGLGSSALQKNAGQRGTAKYYTNCITNHDFQYRIVKGDRLNIGYAAILAPYIPLWYMGDEFNAANRDATLYFETVNFAETNAPSKRLFLEDVKAMLRLRREMDDLFAYWPQNHRDTNICAVPCEGFGSLTAYARFAGDRAVLVVPNQNKNPSLSCAGSVTVPLEECGLAGGSLYRVTDLSTGLVIAEGSAAEIASFAAAIPPRAMGLYLVEKIA